MALKIALIDWESRLEAELCKDAPPDPHPTGWCLVQVPHNWQDYHGYRQISHGDLHGRAFYRTRLAADLFPLSRDQRVRLRFEAVSGTATVFINGKEAGQHIGGLVGFCLDVTEFWKRGQDNEIEVRTDFASRDTSQPFYCGGCHGAPFSEGPQPKGICRPVHIEATGPAYFEKDGVYLWSDTVTKSSTQPTLRYEVVNPSSQPLKAVLHTRLIDADGTEVAVMNRPVQLQAERSFREEIELPTIYKPRLWSPAEPDCYTLIAELRDTEGNVWDQQEQPCGFRQLTWPTIAEPDADHDSRSADSRGRCIDDGLAEASEANHFYNEQLLPTEPNQSALKVGSIRIRGEIVDDEAALKICAQASDASASTDLIISGEITNDAGTVFYHQFNTAPDAFPVQARLNEPRVWVWNFPFLYRLTLTVREAASGETVQRVQVRFAFKEGRELLNIGLPRYEKPENEPPHPIETLDDDKKVFRVNDEPILLNGSCAYETLLGNDYAWEADQVRSFCAQYAAAGFNAFRDGHLPHNLQTYAEWDHHGVLCWTQMGSHLYFDTAEFRRNYKAALRSWVRERRNHPCIFAWGLQNESILPEDFARELCQIIREEDPTASKQRLITTCNGGKGSDWNVPQEWSGTYGGNCHDSDVERAQLIGEYGSWRHIGVHQDKDYEGDENDFSESWATYSLGVKLQRALERQDRAMGLFQWAFTSFPNPGRSIERGEGLGLNNIAPVNSKGLLTAWLQPTDAYYLFQSTLADPAKLPMVYITSHTWPERWSEPGTKDRILVYSNCDEVEVFNDVGRESLGVVRNPGPGKPFRWDQAKIVYGALYAEGRIEGKTVAKDIIRFPQLPEAPGLHHWVGSKEHIPSFRSEGTIRYNCGGSDYTDSEGNHWIGDRPWQDGNQCGSLSWGDDFELEQSGLASFGQTSDPILGTVEQELYQTFRYGRHRLRFRFDLEAGHYRIHLGLLEPWNGIGCQQIDCGGWRRFDLAANGRTLLRDIDLWDENGTLGAGHITADYNHQGGMLQLHFPRVASAQAVVAWIAIEPIKES